MMQHTMHAFTMHRHGLAWRPQAPCHHLQGRAFNAGPPLQRAACAALPPHRQLPESTSASASSSSASTSTSGSSSRQPEPGPPRRPRWLAWLPPFMSFQKLLQLVQSMGFSVLALGLLMTLRFGLLTQARAAPREVLYSDLMALVDTGRVRSARLESATSRLYFDVTPAATAAAAEAQAAAATAAAVAATPSARAAASPAAAAAAAAGAAEAASTSAAAATPAVVPAFQKTQRQRPYYVKIADKTDQFLVSHILKAGVEFGVIKASFTAGLANAVLSTLAVWLPLLPFFFIMKRMLDQRNGMGNKRKRPAVGASKVTFADVAGVETAKEELMEVVACLRNAARYSKVRARMPGGVLLCGPPGTGKTLLAKAVAGEAGVPFMACSASEFVELFVGRGAARVRELFAEARKQAPCVVFIDELDALGGKRGMGYNDERDQTLNQLLTELDGFEGRPGVLLLAATNRAEVLDPALLRPGRISRRVVVPLPNEEGRRAILRVHLRDIPMASEMEKLEAIERLGAVTNGFSGAELANIVNEATLLTARQDQDIVTLRELLEGVQRTKFGVNGTGPRFGSGVLSRLMDVAAGRQGRPVKVSPV